jgi:hypothetical protein
LRDRRGQNRSHDIDPVAEGVLALDDDVPDMHPDPEPHRIGFGGCGLALPKLPLNVAAHSGRIVKLMGDGALVEFASAVEAVTCAGSIMSRRKAFNRETVAASSMLMRREYPTTSADRMAASLLWGRPWATQLALSERLGLPKFMAHIATHGWFGSIGTRVQPIARLARPFGGLSASVPVPRDPDVPGHIRSGPAAPLNGYTTAACCHLR